MKKSIMGFMIVFLLLLFTGVINVQQTTSIPELRFQWDSNTETDLGGYGFYSSLDPGPPYNLLDNEVPKSETATVDYTATNLTVNINEPTYFVVDAYDTSGNRSGFSNVCEYIHCVPLADENQTVACPEGYTGTGIVQKRSSSCVVNSLPIWGAWVEIGRSCTALPACTPSSGTRTESCGTGYTGSRIYTRTSTCPTRYGTPVWGNWILTSDTCAVLPPTCSESVQTQSRTCDAGYTGQITESRTSSCPDPYGQPVWTGWVVTSNTCTPINTCQPLPTETKTELCPTGFAGLIYYERTSTCPGPVWGPWIETNRTCASTGCVSTTETRTIRCTKWYEKGSITQQRTLICNSDGTSYWTAWTTVISNCRPWWRK